MGEIARHGPHQGAQKSTTTGVSPAIWGWRRKRACEAGVPAGDDVREAGSDGRVRYMEKGMFSAGRGVDSVLKYARGS
jgi:hypothetical protein